MKHKIFKICASVICVGSIAATAFATTGIINFAEIGASSTVEENEISAALSNSNVLDSNRAPLITKECDIIDEANMMPQSISLNNIDALQTDTTYDNIKLYNVVLSDEVNSVYNNIGDCNDSWIVPEIGEDKFSYIYLEKGEELKTVADRINSLNISDERKQKMLAKAVEREGKWYVSRVETQRNFNDAANFVDSGYMTTLIENNNIADVIGTKYVFIENLGIPALSINTETGEYIVPQVAPNRFDGIECNKIYSISEFINAVLN